MHFTGSRSARQWIASSPDRWGKVLVARLALRLLPITFDAKKAGDPAEPFAKEFVLDCFRVAILLWRCLRLGGEAESATQLVSAAEKLYANSNTIVRIKRDSPNARSAGLALHFAALFVAGKYDQFDNFIQHALQSSFEPNFKGHVFSSLSFDSTLLERNRRPADFFVEPLWSEDVRDNPTYRANLPGWARASLNRFSDLVDQNPVPWMLWVKWYRSIIPATYLGPVESSISVADESRIIRQNESFWEREPDVVIHDVAKIIEWMTTDSDAAPNQSMAEFIVDFLNGHNSPADIEEVATALGLSGHSTIPTSVRGRLNELTDAGKIQRVGRGIYASINFKETSDTADDLSQIIPEQEPGVSFVLGPGAKFQVADSGRVEAADRSEIMSVKDAILESLDDLETACERSNAFKFLTQVISRYRSAIGMPLEQVSVDRLYAQGVRLENAKLRIEKEIQSGDLPDQGVDIGEALDSVISLHGPMIMGTERGRSLVSRSRDYHQTESEVAEYKAKARQFIAAVDQTNDLIEAESKDILTAAVEDIGEGRHPERSTEIARTANNNLVVAMGKLITSPAGVAASSVFGAAVANSVPGTLASAEVTTLLDACWSFFLANSEILRALAGATGGELSWVNSLINWMNRNLRSRAN